MGIVLCAVILAAIALGLWPSARPPRAAIAVGALLGAYGALTLASSLWASSAEAALIEFDRAALFLVVFLAAVLASTALHARTWVAGLAGGIIATSVLSLAGRFFPGLLPDDAVAEALPAAAARLSYPVGYWNGLAILAALAVPMLLSLALSARTAPGRGVAVGVVPVAPLVCYLASSRGGFAVLLVGVVAFLAASGRRWAAGGTILVGLAGSALALAVVATQSTIVDGPLDSPAAADEGRIAALLAVLICVATGGAYAALASRVRVSPTPRAGRAVIAAAVLFAVAASLLSDPLGRFEAFKQPPPERPAGEFVATHLASSSGSGRWQYWTAGIDAFRDSPLLGQGAGAYEAWWTEHGTLATPVRDAHSLYVEALAETGVLGFALLAGALLTTLVAGIRRTAGDDTAPRELTAGLLAAVAAFILALGIDWMWEQTVVAAVGFACLGLLVGPATLAGPREVLEGDPPPGESTRRIVYLAAGLTVGWLVLCAQVVPLLTEIKLDDSREAAERGDLVAATEHAMQARNLQPWASTPYLQLALVAEEQGDLQNADRWIGEATSRATNDWRLWLVASRIETKRGEIETARDSLARARNLNPRSPLFADR